MGSSITGVGAADAAAHRDGHLRRDEIDRRQVLAEQALHLGEQPLPLGERRRRRLPLHQVVDLPAPTAWTAPPASAFQTWLPPELSQKSRFIAGSSALAWKPKQMLS